MCTVVQTCRFILAVESDVLKMLKKQEITIRSGFRHIEF